MARGKIKVNTQNIFPIIKQSLYSEQEIFLRELVSNAVDATQKIKHLSALGEFKGELGDLKIRISIDKDAGTLTISDSGLGMDNEEVKKYLNQVAFSGAEEFIQKYEKAGDEGDIIGKFGLGFYSAFMVADTVEVQSRSWKEDADPVKWTCDGTTSYNLSKGQREERGTDVILHISEDAKEYLEDHRIREILNKYCRFLPVEVEFEEKVINNTDPIWRKAPADLKDEDYLAFFKELYPMEEDPLFWIHLNVDYPFELTGVLYFPRIRENLDPRKQNIQLYSRQVFITDEVSQLVPDYLMLLQGVIDSPDIPLNVSRSYLQGDPNVRKISSYITRKVADKLHDIFTEDRKKFEEKWPDINVFIKYGMLTDDKFYERAEKFLLVQDVEDKYYTLEEYREHIKEKQTDKDDTLVLLYTSHRGKQDAYVSAAQARGYDVLHMNGPLDSHFIGLLERKMEKTRWARVDSDTLDKLIPKGDETKDEGIILTEEQENRIKEAFVGILPKKEMQVQLEKAGTDHLPVSITLPEFVRRMRDMAATGGMSYMGQLPETYNVVVNTSHPAIKAMADEGDHSQQARQLLDLALLSQHMLEGKELTEFIKRSVDLMKE